MSKNILQIFIFFILCSYNIGFHTYAFLGEEAGLDLYSIIDEGLEDLDKQNLYYELSGTEDSITNKVNQLIKQYYNIDGCISGDLSPSNIIDISAGNTKTLTDKLGDNCKNSDGSFNIDEISLLQVLINEHYENAQLLAKEKTEQIQKIGSVGLYADGILENGSFDLIQDLRNIDSIIFHKETIYVGEEYEDINKLFEEKQEEKRQVNLLNTTDPEVREEIIKISPNYTNVLEIDNITDINVLKSIVNEPFSFTGGNNYVCKEGVENHGFESQLLDKLTGKVSETNKNEQNGEIGNNSGENDSGIIGIDDIDSGTQSDIQELIENSGKYVEVNDNGLWPCSNFFCITVDFVVYDQPLFGGSQDITIEYLIDRSNQHLRKFANSFLGQSQMTVGNFELGLKDLNLPDLFHMSFQIQKKPVPILTLEKKENGGNGENKVDNSETSSNTLLEEYYKAYNLDYKRRNDITQFLQQDKEYKTILNNTDLAINDFVEKREELGLILEENTKKADIINKNIDNKFRYETLGDFDKQFIELNNFTDSIAKYTENLGNIIIAMGKIPIDG